MIAFADSGIGGNDDLYVMRADGAGLRRLTRTPRWGAQRRGFAHERDIDRGGPEHSCPEPCPQVG
jgi:hypothetical protein